jgi:uncharacterized protein YjbI with pentapeptide repeats
MANAEHLKVVQGGSESVNRLRQNYSGRLNLRYASLRGVNLSGADLSRACLFGANLSYAKLNGANLSSANLREANLYRADLSKAKLMDVQAYDANFQYANLYGANLCSANLDFANFSLAELFNAKLTCSSLVGTLFFYTDLFLTDFKDATMDCTAICGCDLSKCINLDTVKHTEPSSITLDTITQSYYGAGKCYTNILESFLTNAGVPKQLLNALSEILSQKEVH